MPFTKENAALLRGTGGRPKREVSEAKRTAQQIVREILESKAEAIVRQYTKRTLGKNADRILCHAIDKLLPNEQIATPTTQTINFIQFNNNPTQLPSEGLPITVLASDEPGEEERGDGVAQEKRQGQNGVKFRNF